MKYEKSLAAYLTKRIFLRNSIDCCFNEHIVKQLKQKKCWGFLYGQGTSSIITIKISFYNVKNNKIPGYTLWGLFKWKINKIYNNNNNCTKKLL